MRPRAKDINGEGASGNMTQVADALLVAALAIKDFNRSMRVSGPSGRSETTIYLSEELYAGHLRKRAAILQSLAASTELIGRICVCIKC